MHEQEGESKDNPQKLIQSVSQKQVSIPNLHQRLQDLKKMETPTKKKIVLPTKTPDTAPKIGPK